MKKQIKLLSVAFSAALLLGACTSSSKTLSESSAGSETSSVSSDTFDTAKTLVYGTGSYGVGMSDAGLNPHEDYSGWSCVRYGVGETLFRLNEDIELVPWLAESYKFLDDNTLEVVIKDGINFSSGRKLDAAAAKECFEDLIAVHDRAPKDMKIQEIKADGQTLTFVTTEPNPALLNFLAEPYTAIIDMQAGVDASKNVSGTGPYKATAVSDSEISLVSRDDYWGGEVSKKNITVKSITDGDTLTMGLQSGELDATSGLPYASYPLFENDNYNINSVATSRAFFLQLNFDNALLTDKNIRSAIAMAIDKEGFVNVLLGGHGKVANGPFPMKDSENPTYSFSPEKSKELLANAGWSDSDNDGYVDKDGKNLELNYITYPGRTELPILAQSIQANLKDIGIKLNINSTENYLEVMKDSTTWDIFGSAMVTNPTGNKGYFFDMTSLTESPKNRGHYSNAELDELAKTLSTTFENEKREEIAKKMSDILVDDCGFIFVSHLQMSLVSKKNIKGLTPMPSDYYEFSKDLVIE
nr:ABC transporter substrate-binding protein [uncultured Lachnoanaerobaculum sp.]